MPSRLEHFEQCLINAHTITECECSLKDYLLTLNIQTYSFTLYNYQPPRHSQVSFDCCTEDFKPWHQHYHEHNYKLIDSTLSHVYEQLLPIHWDLGQQLAQANSDKERQLRRDSQAFGAKEGLSIPIHGPRNGFAILLLVKMQSQSGRLNDIALHHEAQTAGLLFYHYLQAHLFNDVSGVAKHKLTTREIQCLMLLSRDYSLKQMAQHLELSERTVNFHFQKLNKKLGAKNKYQSLNKALQLNLLTPCQK